MEREQLSQVIRQWNSNRLDLFEISQPDENLEFHGVIRFYFEDHTEGNVATKCLRVSSKSQTREVIETLSEKFRPDLKMLSTAYSLYEIHKDKDRKLDLSERPLLVQLKWTSDSREGRFVLKRDHNSLEERYHMKERVLQTFKRSLSRKGKENQTSPAEEAPGPSDQPGLPVLIHWSDAAEEPLLSAVISYTSSATAHFKLSPAYILYAASRSVLQHHRKQDTQAVTSLANKIVAMMDKVVQRQQSMAGAMVFWMANSSELLNFLKRDKEMSAFTQQSQLDLSHLVHTAYSFLLQCLQTELRKHLPTFLMDPEQHSALPAGIEMVLNTLMNAMSLSRRCHVNPALTIQLFSQLFHFIGSWLFNQLMGPEASTCGLRSHCWGATLRQRLTPIEAWAERQGLELAADCHLGHITQATALLTMNKYSVQDAEGIEASCFKLNSLQLRTLLEGYLYGANEPRVPMGLVDAVAQAAEASADRVICSEGRNVELEESLELHLPFLLPEGGYSCGIVRGIPPGLREFLEPVCLKGLCSLTCPSSFQGDWTVYFSEVSPCEEIFSSAHREPEIETITLHKPPASGMGVSIVAAKGARQTDVGIYIKSVVPGGSADKNGRLSAGDQLLSVDGHSLLGLSQERAAALMVHTGPVVTLQVAKFAASYHGLKELLSEPPAETTLCDTEQTKANWKGATLYCVVDLGSDTRKKEQMLQRNRQLYRSDPNMTADFSQEEIREPSVLQVRGNYIKSISTYNLCSETTHREYLTLPNSKSKEKVRPGLNQPPTLRSSPSHEQISSRRSCLRQALSQDNLCVDTGGPVMDERTWTQKNQTWKQTGSMLPSSVPTHNVPTNHRLQGGPSTAGVWRTPFLQQSTLVPSVQPVRIDIPITRGESTQSNPPLITFQQSSKTPTRGKQTHLYACPVPAAKKLPPPLALWHQQRSAASQDRAEKPKVSIVPTKHVSFQEPPPQQRSTRPTKQKEPGELCASWRREDQEKQQRLQRMEQLQQEVQQLEAKDESSAEETGRLRRLSLERHFQKRLQEAQQRAEAEEDDEELDTMRILQELAEKTSEAKKKRSAAESTKKLQEKVEHEMSAGLSHEEEEKTADQERAELRSNNNRINSKEIQEKNSNRVSAPEKLPFRERQRLFSLTASA